MGQIIDLGQTSRTIAAASQSARFGRSVPQAAAGSRQRRQRPRGTVPVQYQYYRLQYRYSTVPKEEKPVLGKATTIATARVYGDPLQNGMSSSRLAEPAEAAGPAKGAMRHLICAAVDALRSRCSLTTGVACHHSACGAAGLSPASQQS